MAENSKIEWTDHTFNPWSGCSKVAEGCKFCYAEVNYSVKMRGVKWGPNGNRILAAAGTWKEPLKWNKKAAAAGVRKRVFCASLADVFEDWQGPIHDHKGDMLWGQGDLAPAESPITMIDVRRKLFALIDATPWLDWQLLTKRPENIRRKWPQFALPTIEQLGKVIYRPNVWLGTSIATQSDADKNIPELLKCRDLSPVLFVSAEPLIEAVDLTWVGTDDKLYNRWNALNGTCAETSRTGGVGWDFIKPNGTGPLDWVIIGGESGPRARPCDIAWIRSLKDQCAAAGVPCFVKQVGARCVLEHANRHPAAPPEAYKPHGYSFETSRGMLACHAGWIHTEDPKGGDWSEWPNDLRVREFPRTETDNAE